MSTLFRQKHPSDLYWRCSVLSRGEHRFRCPASFYVRLCGVLGALTSP